MSLSYEETLEILKETGALKEGHFRLTSGLHSDHYAAPPPAGPPMAL